MLLCVCTDISIHRSGEAYGLLLAAADSFLQRVDHLLVRVHFIIEQHAVVGVLSLPADTHTHTQCERCSMTRLLSRVSGKGRVSLRWLQSCGEQVLVLPGQQVDGILQDDEKDTERTADHVSG